MRRWLVPAVKLLLVAALMAWVFTSVQWRDRMTVQRPDGTGVETVGRIEGDWSGAVVRFVPDAGAPGEVRVGRQPDGSVVHVGPGIVTFWGRLDLTFFLLGALCYFVCAVTAAARWWWLLHINAIPTTMLQAQRYTWIGMFWNNVVPGATGGDLVKAIYIMKHAPGARVRALVSVLVDRVMGLGSLALLAAIVVLFALDRFMELAVAVWGVLGAVFALGVVAFSKRLRRAVHLDDLLNRLPPRLSGVLKKVDGAIYFYRQHKLGIGVWMLLGMVNHMISVTSVYLIGRGLNVGLPAFEYFVLIPIINMVSAIPIAPNGWGVGEAMFGHLFAKYGAAYLPDVPDAAGAMRTRGVALSVLDRIHRTAWSLLGGVLMLADKDRVTRQDVAAEVERERVEAQGEAAPDRDTAQVRG
jgi:uncharacterized protein (TIRG00374 family)